MADSRVTVKVSDASVCIQDNWLLKGVSFECHEGEWTLVFGPSGAGKSTLLRAINGLCGPTRGCLWTLDTRIPGRNRRESRAVWKQTGTVLQEVALFETKTALENVELALRGHGDDRVCTRARATEWLERMQLGDKAEQYPCSLSGGERQRVALARAFARRPRLLILDEPTSALDRATARIVLEVVKELVDEGSTVVMASHRVGEVDGLCDQRVALCDGRVSDIEQRPTPGCVSSPGTAGPYARLEGTSYLPSQEAPRARRFGS